MDNKRFERERFSARSLRRHPCKARCYHVALPNIRIWLASINLFDCAAVGVVTGVILLKDHLVYSSIDAVFWSTLLWGTF